MEGFRWKDSVDVSEKGSSLIFLFSSINVEIHNNSNTTICLYCVNMLGRNQIDEQEALCRSSNSFTCQDI